MLGARLGDVSEPPPQLGEHTDEVLREILHLSERDIEELRAAQAI